MGIQDFALYGLYEPQVKDWLSSEKLWWYISVKGGITGILTLFWMYDWLHCTVNGWGGVKHTPPVDAVLLVGPEGNHLAQL